VLRDKRTLLRLQLPGRLLFLFRIRFGLYAVLARLGRGTGLAETGGRDVRGAVLGTWGRRDRPTQSEMSRRRGKPPVIKGA
jgi:hypothetical protein